ncbi:MAG: nucleoside hydrolase [Chloroflexi bacterium]|nr:nucleoside hydrolase [Chloroflexota bacterium]
MSKRKFIIDTDTASDDAVALLMALRSPNVDVLAITEVMGNVDVQQGSINARYTVELCEKTTPVYLGCAKPLYRKPVFAHWYHGPDGMGGMNYPAPRAAAAEGHAVDVIIDLVKTHPGEITLVTLGPLTNIAVALARAPEIAALVQRCVIMGGASVYIGNVTPAAEYNMWVDPEAARMVLRSGMNIELISWETGIGAAGLTNDEIAYAQSINTPLAKFAIDCNVHALRSARDWLGDPGLIINDAVTMAIALDPSIVDRHGRYRVDIETQGELTRGMTVVDLRNVIGTQAEFTDAWAVREPNAQVVFTVQPQRWKEILFQAIAG